MADAKVPFGYRGGASGGEGRALRARRNPLRSAGRPRAGRAAQPSAIRVGHLPAVVLVGADPYHRLYEAGSARLLHPAPRGRLREGTFPAAAGRHASLDLNAVPLRRHASRAVGSALLYRTPRSRAKPDRVQPECSPAIPLRHSRGSGLAKHTTCCAPARSDGSVPHDGWIATDRVAWAAAGVIFPGEAIQYIRHPFTSRG